MQFFQLLRERLSSGRVRGVELFYLVVSATGMLLVLISLLYVSLGWLRFWASLVFGHHHNIDWSTVCPQPAVLEPPSAKLGVADASHFLTSDYRKLSAELLGGAVSIPTESYDDMDQDPLKEPRFKVFKDFHEYLADSFPLVTKNLEVVNTYGLLYTIKGSGNEKPVVLMAHQDVVPVERQTLDQWTHGAFSGYFDGEKIWGRGSSDTKSSLLAILEATESLLSQKWVPERTILISFGFDEELDGSRGALTLADTIRERYGSEESIYMIVDEGSGVAQEMDAPLILVSISEKGYTDIILDVYTQGGHSSAPPDHTGIGIISEVLTRLEDTHIKRNAYRLEKGDIIAETYACIAKYGDIEDSRERESLLDENYLTSTLGKSEEYRGLIGTTQAIDVIRGGVKINALPEKVSATVNYRIDIHESVADVTSRVQDIVEDVASLYKLGVSVNGHSIFDATAHGNIAISNGQSIEPAPVSPFDVGDECWDLLTGTSKHMLSKWFGYEDVPSAPLLMGGNTDTWRYQGLTNHIYRFTPNLPDGGANAHTVDEYITLDSHLAVVVWYYELLQFF